jgi:hypothetical protein
MTIRRTPVALQANERNHARRISARRAYEGAAASTAVCRAALLGVVLVLIVVAYFPFAWSPPRMVHNQVTRSADGSLRFGEMNYARTPGTPAWLPDARGSGTIQIQVQAYPQTLQQNASMMMLASDFWHTDFAIGQDYSSLTVWLLRPGSDINGDPPFVIPGALQPQRWNSVSVILQRGDFRIEVDGRTRLAQHLLGDTTQVWGPGQIALGDEVHGGGPWQGQIRLAQVRTWGYAVDYVRPGALLIPASYLYLPDHIEPFPPMNRGQWMLAFLDLLSFIPVGFLIVWSRRSSMHPVPATLLAAALAVALAAGKFLFNARHTSLANLVMQAVGGLLGALLASWLAHAKLRTTRAPSVPGS